MTGAEKEERFEKVARVCHEVNRFWCEANGDMSQRPWMDAEDWQRDSTCRGVQVALDGATPEEQHEAWCQDKLEDGWVYGLVKDEIEMTHPSLVPYGNLPETERVKDELFVMVVRVLAPVLRLG